MGIISRLGAGHGRSIAIRVHVLPAVRFDARLPLLGYVKGVRLVVADIAHITFHAADGLRKILELKLLVNPFHLSKRILHQFFVTYLDDL